jgi:predicted house-cleaning noncanonical NTP pyrophosphatase (MazG superfamily)
VEDEKVMNNKFQKLLANLKKLNLPDREYVIYGSSPLGARRIRDVHDLDVVVTDNLYKKLLEKYREREVNDGKKRFIKLGRIELIPASHSLIKDVKKTIANADVINGLKFVKLEYLLKWKRKMRRQKDFKDIKLIKNYLRKRRVKKYNKLIRDKILEIIEKSREVPFWKILNKREFLKELKRKILEEAKELIKAKTKKEMLNEIVDIQELIDNLILELNFKKSEIKKAQKIKRKKRGGFKKRLFLFKTEKFEKIKRIKW